MTKEIAKKPETGLLPFSVEDMAADAQLGGKTTIADVGIPFLYILQGLSPQVQPGRPKYIEGAQASMLYVTVYEKVLPGLKDGINLVPCFYERLMVEWVDRDAGGGIVGSYEPGDPIEQQTTPDDRGIPRLIGKGPKGKENILQETAYWYCLAHLDGNWKQLVIPMKSTHLKVSKKWNSQLATTYIPGSEQVAPRWLHVYNFRSLPEEKNGNHYFVPQITKGDVVSKELYAAAREYAKVASGGLLRRKALASESAGEAGSRRINDDEVPF